MSAASPVVAPRLPQLDEAIALLQSEVAALRAGQKDANLPALAVAVAAGEAPLPEPQFAPLLALWAPAPGGIPAELAVLVDRLEAARQREEAAAALVEDIDASVAVPGPVEAPAPVVEHAALERVRGRRRRPRTRPRRRFEDPDDGDASQSASDGVQTPTASPRAAVAAIPAMTESEGKQHAVVSEGASSTPTEAADAGVDTQEEMDEKPEELKTEKQDSDGDQTMEGVEASAASETKPEAADAGEA
ncbi:hypothetical protein BBJ28_00021518, partial [Nothophytophthora sp. Chile5]